MGGNAIKESVRFDNKTKKIIEREVWDFISRFSAYSGYMKHVPECRVVRSYTNKVTHGDLDVVVLADELFENPKWFIDLGAALQSDFNIPEHNIKKNSNVVSFGLPLDGNVYQVDLIFHRSDVFDIACHYYNWNDLGNLIGRIAHSLGFRYGHEGLFYIHRNGDEIYGKTLISRNITKILSFLGYVNNTRILFDFESLQDIFEFVAESKYFNPDIYLLHNRNSISRRRDAKRHTYREFLKWCETLPEKDYFVRSEDKTVYLPLAFEAFPEFQKEFQRVEIEYDKRRIALDERRKYYNGKLMMEWTGLKGKDLGAFMKFFEGQNYFVILEGKEYEKHAKHLFQSWKKTEEKAD